MEGLLGFAGVLFLAAMSGRGYLRTASWRRNGLGGITEGLLGTAERLSRTAGGLSCTAGESLRTTERRLGYAGGSLGTMERRSGTADSFPRRSSARKAIQGCHLVHPEGIFG